MPSYFSYDDPYQGEPSSNSRGYHHSPARRPLASDYDHTQPESPSPFSDRRNYNTPPPTGHYYGNSPYDTHDAYDSHSTPQNDMPPEPPRHGERSYYHRSPPAHSEHGDYGAASGGLAGVAHNVADRNPRDSGMEAARGGSQLPPPPSRTATNNMPYGGGYMYETYSNREIDSPMRSTTSSLNNIGHHSDPYGDDVYGYSSSSRSVDRRLGEVNPNDIEDDGDDGLHYPRRSQRNSMLSSGANSDRFRKSAFAGATAVGGAAGAGGAVGGLLSWNRPAVPEYNLADGTEKSPENWEKKRGLTKRCRCIIILIVALVILGAVVGGVVGGVFMSNRGGGGGSKHSGQSAEDDIKENGDLDINSEEIKDLMNNPDLHKVFPGMDYTPIHAQYPYCMHDPPSQNNITRDIAVLSQLTDKVRTYGTDCNQTEMVIHAIRQLELEDDMKIWMGVWQDKNETTNARQLEQMWDILDEYGDKHFEGLIVANEILFRKEMDITELGTLLADVRKNLTRRDLNLPVATSDLGDDWTTELADESDYLMGNIHPFFAGVPADEAAEWTMNFWNRENGPMFKTDDKRNIISETGWPTGGGTSCGKEGVTDCPDASVAGVDELNQFMKDWVCPALKNGTQYFWFSAFDEPWKESFNEKGKEWEDKWGLMDVNRNLKDGVKIPDCDGKTI